VEVIAQLGRVVGRYATPDVRLDRDKPLGREALERVEDRLAADVELGGQSVGVEPLAGSIVAVEETLFEDRARRVRPLGRWDRCSPRLDSQNGPL